MLSAGAPGGSGARGPGGSGGRKRGHPLGSRNKDKGLAATPPVSRKRGHPLGSRNKKTLAALAAAAAMVSAEAAPAAVATVSAEAAHAAPAAVVSTEAAPAAATGNSSDAVAGAAHKSWHPPEKQRPAYTSVNGYTTFLAPLWAGCKVRLPLPFRFVDTMGGNMPTHAIMEECSGG
jgi:hypothetical protein